MQLFFDVDYTLIAYNGSLRPLVHKVFEDLKSDGHDIYIWSGMGLRNKEIEENNLTEFVSGIYHKPIDKFEDGLIQYGIPVRPEYVVDDHREVVDHFGGFVIRAYFWENARVKEMTAVYEDIKALS